MINGRLRKLFAERVRNADFDPGLAGFKNIPGTQVFYKRIKANKKRPILGELSAEETSDVHGHIFEFLRRYAEAESPRDVYKSAGAIVGRHAGNLVVLVSANKVPLQLQEAGIHGESRFEGWKRGESENATVHFEMHCQLAAGMLGSLTDVVMFNCDYMCPNCAKYTAVFGAKACVVDDVYQTRPLMSRIISREGVDHRVTTAQILGKAGIGLSSYNVVNGLIRLDGFTKSDFVAPVDDERYARKEAGPIDETRLSVVGRLHKELGDAESAAALIFYKKGRTRIYYATPSTFSEHETYNGHAPGDLDPLSMLLVHASSQGYNVKNAEIYYRGKLDVNCALHAAVASPKWIYLADGYDCLAPGAAQIFELTGQKIIEPMPPKLYVPMPTRQVA